MLVSIVLVSMLFVIAANYLKTLRNFTIRNTQESVLAFNQNCRYPAGNFYF